MTKIDEIYDKYCYDKYGLSSARTTFEDRKDDIQLAMKEYAEIYARKCLEIAYQSLLERNAWIQSEEEAIKEIKLPEHE